MKKFREQRHRYVYSYNDNHEGHIMWAGSEVTLCGMPLDENKLERVLLKFVDGRDLCHDCKIVFKNILAEKHGIKGW